MGGKILTVKWSQEAAGGESGLPVVRAPFPPPCAIRVVRGRLATIGSACLLRLVTCMAVLPASALADGPGRIYTQAADSDTGKISGTVNGASLSHAIAVERDRTRVYLATLDAGGTGFRFEKLPVGRFDLVLVTTDGRVIEGLGLGPPSVLADERAKHLAAGIAKADSFFNRHQQHRAGVDGEVALALVERLRDGQILRGSGEEINANLRRLEIIELREAGDDWQMLRTRHLYREEAPRVKGLPFLTHTQLPALGGLRLAGTQRDLGTLDLTKK